MASMTHFTTLTREIDLKTSPIRQYLESRFPNRAPLQKEYAAAAGSLLVDSQSTIAPWPGRIGSAFDFHVRFAIDAKYTPDIAMKSFLGDPEIIDKIAQVASVAGASGQPVEQSAACWALALCTEVYRTPVDSRHPIIALIERGEITADAMLRLMPEPAGEELSALRAHAKERLLPRLEGPYHLGPDFDGSRYCAADADLISNGTLLDLKTRLGTKNARTGVRSDKLSLPDLYQLIAYALFDLSDHYGIHSIGVFSARYANLVTWRLDDAMEILAGKPVSIAEERERMRSILSQ